MQPLEAVKSIIDVKGNKFPNFLIIKVQGSVKHEKNNHKNYYSNDCYNSINVSFP